MEKRVESRHSQRCRANPARTVRRGFSLIDLLVSIAIIALLIAISLPYMSGVREQARRVVCGANLRSVGSAMLTYANDNEEHIPSSVFLGSSADGSDDFSAQMNHTRVTLTKNRTPEGAINRNQGPKSVWDGLGVLFIEQHLSSSKVFYCPKGVRRLDRIVATAAMVSDSLTAVDEYNHRVGTNVLRAGLAVEWVPDNQGYALASQLQPQPNPQGGSVTKLWNVLDTESKEN